MKDHNIAIPKVALLQSFNSLVHRKATVIFEKEQESMTPILPINNSDFTIPNARLDVTSQHAIQECEPAHPIVLSDNLHKFWAHKASAIHMTLNK